MDFWKLRKKFRLCSLVDTPNGLLKIIDTIGFSVKKIFVAIITSVFLFTVFLMSIFANPVGTTFWTPYIMSIYSFLCHFFLLLPFYFISPIGLNTLYFYPSVMQIYFLLCSWKLACIKDLRRNIFSIKNAFLNDT